MLRTLSKRDQEDISMPHQIKAIFEEMPSLGIELMDYDYTGTAKEVDYTSFASSLYNMFAPDSHFILVLHSSEMKNSRLLRKMFRFNLTGYDFSEKIETCSVPVNETSIIFLGIISIKTFEDFRFAVRFLFSGTYDSQNIMMYSRRPFDIDHIKVLLKESLHLNINRHGDIQNVNISLPLMIQHKNELKVMYPYGGTDFGSFMLFMF